MVFTSSGYNFLIRVPVTSSGYKFRLQVQVTSSGYKFRVQVPVTSSGYKFQFQVPVTNSGYRFRLKLRFTSSFQVCPGWEYDAHCSSYPSHTGPSAGGNPQFLHPVSAAVRQLTAVPPPHLPWACRTCCAAHAQIPSVLLPSLLLWKRDCLKGLLAKFQVTLYAKTEKARFTTLPLNFV